MGPGGLVGGMIGGLVGACVWAGVEYTTGSQLGWIAWGIGALAGIGVQVGGRATGGAAAGVLAAAIAVAAVVAAKGMTAGLIASSIGAEQLAIAEIADGIQKRYVVEGFNVQLNEDARTPIEYYPPEIWADAERAWRKLDSDERESRVQQVAGLAGEFNRRSLLSSFSPWDILWFLLAVATAWKLGSASGSGVVEGPINFEEVPADGGLPAELRAEERKQAAARKAVESLERASMAAGSLTGILGVAGSEGKTVRKRRGE